MNKLKLAFKLGVLVLAIGLFMAFRISNIDFHCSPKSTGLSYCRLNNSPPRFLEGAAALFPEDLQVAVGGKVALLIPKLITPDQSDKAVKLAHGIYQQMAEDKKWVFAHSSLGFTYERMLHFQGAADQYFVYIPEHPANQKLPVLLFLHGYGGNFTSYLYLLAQAADTAKFAIVAPTYKQGEWDQDSVSFVQKVLAEAGTKFPIDTERISLMGISNGGLIVSNLIPVLGDKLRNVVLLSTYTELGQYTEFSVLSILQRLNRVEFIYGDKDERIDASSIPTKVQKLVENGVNAYYSKIPGEDHFLFFSQPDKVQVELLNLQF